MTAVHIEVKNSHTEVQHTTYGDVTAGVVEPVTAGKRQFNPSRVTVHYGWRTQLGDTGWTIGNIHVSGPWLDPEKGAGSGFVILGTDNAPEWCKTFATDNLPTSRLVDQAAPDQH